MIQHLRPAFDGHERDGLASVKRGASTSRRDGTRRTRVLLLRLDLHPPLESIHRAFIRKRHRRADVKRPLGRRSVHPPFGFGFVVDRGIPRGEGFHHGSRAVARVVPISVGDDARRSRRRGRHRRGRRKDGRGGSRVDASVLEGAPRVPRTSHHRRHARKDGRGGPRGGRVGRDSWFGHGSGCGCCACGDGDGVGVARGAADDFGKGFDASPSYHVEALGDGHRLGFAPHVAVEEPVFDRADAVDFVDLVEGHGGDGGDDAAHGDDVHVGARDDDVRVSAAKVGREVLARDAVQPTHLVVNHVSVLIRGERAAEDVSLARGGRG